MIKNKKNIIIGILGLMLITALVLAIVNRRKSAIQNQDSLSTGNVNFSQPEFLTSQEKAAFSLDDNIKAQVLKRDANGQPAVYKLINSDADIVNDASKIGSLSPRQEEINK